MKGLSQALLTLDYLYLQGPLNIYEQAREKLEVQIQSLFSGFTIAHAIEIGTVGAGDKTYHHGGSSSCASSP